AGCFPGAAARFDRRGVGADRLLLRHSADRVAGLTAALGARRGRAPPICRYLYDRLFGRVPAAAPKRCGLGHDGQAGDGFRRRLALRGAGNRGGANAAQAQNCTRWVSAPSMIRLVPVIKLARGLARKTTALATSCGVPMRPVGLRASIDLNISGLRSSTMFHTPPLK